MIGQYLLAYGVIGMSASIFSVASSMVLKLYCSLRSSRKLHDDSFAALMKSPLSFFELTPTGRILNLFSRDIFVIDEVLVNAMGSFFRTVSRLALAGAERNPDCSSACCCRGDCPRGALRLDRVHSIGFLVPAGDEVSILLISWLNRRYYLATSRELKRLDAVSRSPVFSFFGETLAGLPVIRVSCVIGNCANE